MPAPTTEVKPGPKKNIPPSKPPKRPKAGPKVHGKDAATVPTRVAKQFTIKPWSAEGEGEKIILSGASGMGKTTLAALLERPVFIGADDGGRKIQHPVTGEDLIYVPEVTDFQDVRDLLHSDTFDQSDCTDIVFDTLTVIAGPWAVAYTLQTVKKGKEDGYSFAKHLEDFGWHKGYRHWFETVEVFINDCDRHVRAGRNIVFLTQETGHKISNAEGEDFLKVGPDLHHDKQYSILNYVVSWMDHVFQIAYANVIVKKSKANSTNERAIFIQPTASRIAKSRTIGPEWTSVEFKDKTDDSIWRLLKDPTGGE